MSEGQPRLRVAGAGAGAGACGYAGWDELYLDNVARIHRLMFAKVGNRPDAEDLTAEVFAAAYGPVRLSASIPEVRAYLLATARTVLAGFWRRRLGIQVTSINRCAACGGLRFVPERALDGNTLGDQSSRRPGLSRLRVPRC